VHWDSGEGNEGKEGWEVVKNATGHEG
jgi:hypothetical protein